jgi:hypothetical protein
LRCAFRIQRHACANWPGEQELPMLAFYFAPDSSSGAVHKAARRGELRS